MHKTKKFSILLLVPTFLFIALDGAVPFAFSVECLEKSPAFFSGGEPFGPIVDRDLTKSEHDDIKALLVALDGEWRGTARERYCSFSDAADQSVEDYSVKADVKVDRYGNFFMKMEFYSSKERTTHQKILRFYLNDQRFRIDDDSSAGDVEFINLTKHKIEFLYRVRVRRPTLKGGLHKEFYVYLDGRKDAFSIRSQTYTQGRLSDDHEWHFIRR